MMCIQLVSGNALSLVISVITHIHVSLYSLADGFKIPKKTVGSGNLKRK